MQWYCDECSRVRAARKAERALRRQDKATAKQKRIIEARNAKKASSEIARARKGTSSMVDSDDDHTDTDDDDDDDDPSLSLLPLSNDSEGHGRLALTTANIR